jgi:ESS family glutamate:Na+ symporter
MSLILIGCGIAYVLLALVKKFKVPLVSQVPIWAWAILVMFGVNFIIQKIGLGSLVDSKTKSRIAGILSDYAITAAIASMPIRAVFQYITPILVMVILAYIFTFAGIFLLCRKFFSDCWFERGIAIWGQDTGVFLTGIMLLKICDPEYKTPVLNDYSVSFSMQSVLGFIMLPIAVGVMLNYSFGINVLLHGSVLVASLVLVLIAHFISKRGVA